jgi:hypothetical protein
VFSQNESRNERNPREELISFSPEISPDFLYQEIPLQMAFSNSFPS